MSDFLNQCFVCGKKIDPQKTERNKQLNLPVCNDCKGTDREKRVISDHLESMAEDFVCGCI